MSFNEILDAFLSKENLATAVGLRPPASTTGDLLTALTFLGTGMIVGAGLALLFAPMTGHEIRDGIAEKVGEIGDQFRAQPPAPAASANGSSST